VTTLDAEIPRLKNVLSRAKRSGDPITLLEAVERTLAAFGGAWPNGWSSWRELLDDAYFAWDGSKAREDDVYYDGSAVTERWHAALTRLS
jgi:hypothetical protein